jgi:hypothetical protein
VLLYFLERRWSNLGWEVMGSDLRLLNEVKEGQLTRRVYGTDGRSRLIGKMWVLAGAKAAIWTDGWICKIIHRILGAAIRALSRHHFPLP